MRRDRLLGQTVSDSATSELAIRVNRAAGLIGHKPLFLKALGNDAKSGICFANY